MASEKLVKLRSTPGRPLDVTVNWALEPKAEARMEAAALPCPLETAQTLAKEARPHPMKALQHLAEVVDRLAGFSDPCPSWNQLTPRSQSRLKPLGRLIGWLGGGPRLPAGPRSRPQQPSVRRPSRVIPISEALRCRVCSRLPVKRRPNMRPQENGHHDRRADLSDGCGAGGHVLDLSDLRVALRLNEVTEHLDRRVHSLDGKQQSSKEHEQGDFDTCESKQDTAGCERDHDHDPEAQRGGARRDPHQAREGVVSASQNVPRLGALRFRGAFGDISAHSLRS